MVSVTQAWLPFFSPIVLSGAWLFTVLVQIIVYYARWFESDSSVPTNFPSLFAVNILTRLQWTCVNIWFEGFINNTLVFCSLDICFSKVYSMAITFRAVRKQYYLWRSEIAQLIGWSPKALFGTCKVLFVLQLTYSLHSMWMKHVHTEMASSKAIRR